MLSVQAHVNVQSPSCLSLAVSQRPVAPGCKLTHPDLHSHIPAVSQRDLSSSSVPFDCSPEEEVGHCCPDSLAEAGPLLSQQSVPAAYLLGALCLEGGVGLVMALSYLVLHVGDLGLQREGGAVVYELLLYHLRGKEGQSLAREKLRAVWGQCR